MNIQIMTIRPKNMFYQLHMYHGYLINSYHKSQNSVLKSAIRTPYRIVNTQILTNLCEVFLFKILQFKKTVNTSMENC